MDLASTETERRKRINPFIAELERWADPRSENRADLARLKRCAGRSLAESRAAMELFYDLLYGESKTDRPAEDQDRHRLCDWEEERWFMVASLFPLAPSKIKRRDTEPTPKDTPAVKPPASRNLGTALRELAGPDKKVNPEGVDRRLTVLLDARGDEELRFRLRQAVRMLGQKEVVVDWRRLLEDLLDWDASDRRVQKRWARSYFGLRGDGIAARPQAGAERTETDEENIDAD